MTKPLSSQELEPYLFSCQAIRDRSQQIFDLVNKGQGLYFQLNMDKLEDIGSYVLKVIESNYPEFDIPYHSRWRHIDVGGVNRTQTLRLGIGDNPDELGRGLFDLVIISILVDAGAGPAWSYQEGQKTYTRSEGLAVASFNMFASGMFSNSANQPYQCHAAALKNLDTDTFAKGMHVSAKNPLVGLEGRVKLLNTLGQTIERQPEVFGSEARLGKMFDHLKSKASAKGLKARDILTEVLRVFGNIWPGRHSINSRNLGDTWVHPSIQGVNDQDKYVPFHKLSQWLSYSLFEPLEENDIEILGISDLTGLPEYRNGGLFLDLGVLQLKDPKHFAEDHEPGSPIIVEWRALTICLLDRLANIIRASLPKSKNSMTLAEILQGGTWEAGRKIAREKRPDGSPPLKINSDGTVF